METKLSRAISSHKGSANIYHFLGKSCSQQRDDNSKQTQKSDKSLTQENADFKTKLWISLSITRNPTYGHYSSGENI
jgi:hypothetical protein